MCQNFSYKGQHESQFQLLSLTCVKISVSKVLMSRNLTFNVKMTQKFTFKGRNESKCVKISGLKVKMSQNFSF